MDELDFTEEDFDFLDNIPHGLNGASEPIEQMRSVAHIKPLDLEEEIKKLEHMERVDNLFFIGFEIQKWKSSISKINEESRKRQEYEKELAQERARNKNCKISTPQERRKQKAGKAGNLYGWF